MSSRMSSFAFYLYTVTPECARVYKCVWRSDCWLLFDANFPHFGFLTIGFKIFPARSQRQFAARRPGVGRLNEELTAKHHFSLDPGSYSFLFFELQVLIFCLLANVN